MMIIVILNPSPAEETPGKLPVSYRSVETNREIKIGNILWSI